MATATIRAGSNSNIVFYSDNTYADVLSGAADTKTVLSPQSTNGLGNRYDSGAIRDYTNRTLLVEFDLSSIPSDSIITAATFKLTVASSESGKSGSIELVSHDYGTSITTGDWLSQTNFSAKSVLATWTLPASVSVGTEYSFTSSGLAAQLTPASINRFLVTGNYHRVGTTPTAYEEYPIIYLISGVTDSKKPTLEITYTAGAGTTTNNSLFFGNNF